MRRQCRQRRGAIRGKFAARAWRWRFGPAYLEHAVRFGQRLRQFAPLHGEAGPVKIEAVAGQWQVFKIAGN